MKPAIKFLIVLTLVAGAHFLNVLEIIEHEVMELRYRWKATPAATELVLVEIDEPSLQALNVWPWPRRYYADVIDRVVAAGAKRVALDIDFSSHSTPADDGALARAMENAGIPIILPVFRQAVHGADGEMKIMESRPIESLARHATIAAFNVRPESDGKVRRLYTRENWNGYIIPHYAAMIANQHGGRMLSYYVNYSIDVSTIPRISFTDVRDGRFDPALFRGREVLIGASAVQLGDMVTVPVYRSLPGMTLQAMAYSTLAKGIVIERVNPGLALGAAALVLLLLQFAPKGAGWRWSLAASGGVITLTVVGSLGVAWHYGVYFDITPIVLAAALDFVVRMLGRLKHQDIQLLLQSVAIRRRDMFMRLVVENSFDAIFTVDTKGLVLTYNHAAEEIFGREGVDVIGAPLADLMPHVQVGDETIDLNELLTLRGIHEVRCKRDDGSERILDLSIGQIMADQDLVTICLARDITAKREAEEHARAVEQRLFDSLESVQEGVALFDADDRLVIANRRFRETCRDVLAQMDGKPTYEQIITPLAENGHFVGASEDPKAWVASRMAAHRAPGLPHSDETRDGRWLLTSERRTADGGTIVVETDITILKQREAELVKARDEAEQANRMKSEFLAAMSHELRTPLNAIIGFSEMMQTQVFGPIGSEQYVSYVGDIHSSGKRLLGIINDILDMARIESGQFDLREDRMSLNEAINSALRTAKEMPEQEKVTISADLPKPAVGLVADANVVRAALLKLLSNAIKFTPEGGSVTVTARPRADGTVAVDIMDTGIGMTEDEIETALQPFVQVQGTLAREFEGTGLGLPLARKFAELHGGALEIKSTPGEGTCARLIFPAERVIPPGERKKGAA